MRRGKRVPVARSTSDSAAACLAIVLQRFGSDVDVEELRRTVAFDEADGSATAAIVAAARAHGLRARTVNVDFDSLQYLPEASILRWRGDRFVSFAGVSRRGVRIFDPAAGRTRVVRARTFRDASGDEAVTFERVAEPDGGERRGRRRTILPRRIPYVRQMESADCGAACLVSAFAYFGKDVRLDELRDLTGTGRDGVNARSLAEVARAHGLSAQGVRADVDALEELPPGTILHWEFNHFVVLDRVTRRGVRVVDPAQGRRLVSREELGRAYTGVALTLEPTAEFTRTSSATRGTWRYLRPVLNQTRNLVRVIWMSLLLRLVALAVPLLTAAVVNEIVPHRDRHLLLVFTLGVFVLVAYQFVTSFLRGQLLLELRTRLDMHLTMGFVDHLVELPYAFFLRRSAGDLMMRLQSNTNVREILATGAISALIDGTFATFYLALLFIVSVPLAVVVVVIALVQVLVMLVSWRRNQRLMSESLQAEAKTQSYAYQLLAGIETLKAAGAEHRAADHWAGLFGNQVNVALSRGRLAALVDAATSTLAIAAPLLILLVGAYEVTRGQLSLGSMLAAAALSAGFLQPLGTLVSTGLQLQLMRSYMERINDVLDAPREQDGAATRQAPRLAGHVRAENVSFAYSPLGPEVVRGVSLEVEPGQHVAIVGRSGSGKSTLAHLLLGLYRAESGVIEFDGIDIAELDVYSLRRQLGIVTQRPYLFAASIRDNIALTDPSLPLEAVVAAARIACIDDEIERMPLAYETRLHDGGGSLSGGQQQRIALARALVKRPTLLLLDEATSELDTMTEQRIYENLAGLESTTIVIAHRLSTIRNADSIFVMAEGEIVERGSHAELMDRGGVYRSLVAAQSTSGAFTATAQPTSRTVADATRRRS